MSSSKTLINENHDETDSIGDAGSLFDRQEFETHFSRSDPNRVSHRSMASYRSNVTSSTFDPSKYDKVKNFELY